MQEWSINKAVAPEKWIDFKRWFKAACNLSNKGVTAEEAYKSLGYKVPQKNVRKNPQTKEE